MLPRDANATKTPTGKGRRASSRIDGILARLSGDPDKAVVIDYFRQLVSDDLAEWVVRKDGDVEVHLRAGGAFLLARDGLTRID